MKTTHLSALLAAFLLIASSVIFASSKDAEINSLNQATEHALQQHDYHKALESCDKALKLDPNNINALHKRIVTYMLLKEPEKARPDFARLIKLAKTDTQKYAATAYQYSYYGNYKEAKAELDKAIKLEPKNPELYAARADVYRQLQEYDQALADANKSLNLDAKFFGAYYARARTYEAMGKHDDAKKDFATATDLKAKFTGTKD